MNHKRIYIKLPGFQHPQRHLPLQGGPATGPGSCLRRPQLHQKWAQIRGRASGASEEQLAVCSAGGAETRGGSCAACPRPPRLKTPPSRAGWAQSPAQGVCSVRFSGRNDMIKCEIIHDSFAAYIGEGQSLVDGVSIVMVHHGVVGVPRVVLLAPQGAPHGLRAGGHCLLGGLMGTVCNKNLMQ